MPKMNVSDAAEHFGVSKEAIHNRIRRGSLQSVVQEGVKFVIIDNKANISSPRTNKTQTDKTAAVLDNKYYKFIEAQNITLQAKIDMLEDETKMLRDQKEKMLIQERIKIEEIYLQKDEQLKNILNSLSSKFMLNTPIEESKLDEHVEAEIEIIKNIQENELISLKRYLKKSSLQKSEKQKIKERVKKIAKKDYRIVVIGKKYYINLGKYDYSDLF
ncbi:MAG: DNA-binding protein [Helicobacteraceae bacterium CG2_30_36_10]|nr:MAG: DNA-binding protein [Helicobacteraceae bacterium CG2_30_36_10]